MKITQGLCTVAILALVAIAGWTGFYMWANRTFASASTVPSEWAYLIASWTMPVLLVCVIWLIVMRSSTREASRFGNAARLLSDESALLESRLLTVNRELSLAREFIAAQSRDLESLGRVASERLSTNADRLQALVSENGDRVETIGQVSAAALENMEKLRGQLPVIASSAKDVTNNIGNAGRTAHSQIEEMIRGFQRLNEFGQASENQVISLRDHVNETLSGLFEQCGQLERVAASRFAELGKQSDDLRNHLDRHEIDALAAIRTRTNALAEELDTARTASAQAEHDLLETMSARIAALREEGETLARSLRENEVGAQEAWTDTMRLLASEIEERSQVHARAADIAAERGVEGQLPHGAVGGCRLGRGANLTGGVECLEPVTGRLGGSGEGKCDLVDRNVDRRSIGGVGRLEPGVGTTWGCEHHQSGEHESGDGKASAQRLHGLPWPSSDS